MPAETTELCHVPQTSFRGELGSEQYPYESGRYWLFTAKLCPFAQRVEIARAARGLQDHIGLTIADSVQTEKGWDLVNRFVSDDSAASPVPGIERLPGIYDLANPGYTGRASVPVLFDLKTQTIVNNESAEIIRQLDQASFADPNTPTLYPSEKSSEIDSFTEELEHRFIAPIYRAGFASNQTSHEENFEMVFAFLEKLDRRLEASTYMIGNEPTLADVHAFTHLARIDSVYASLYRLNRKAVRDFANISAYMERVSRLKGFSDTLHIPAIREGYFLSWNQPSDGKFVPVGPPVDERTGVLAA